MAKVKIGVFGAGRGMTAINQLFENQDAELVAVCDKYKPLLDKCKAEAEKHGLTNIAFYEDFDEFFKHDMDAVMLANYAHEHAKYAIKFLRSGRHVMTECLTMANMAEAVELIEAVEQSGKVYCYSENYCYAPARWEMRELYRKGVIGELMYAEGEYIHDCSSIWPSITYGQRDHWRNQNSAVFYCTHSIGPIIHMTGLRPVQVVAFETQSMPFMRDLGMPAGCAGMEIVTLENGAILKSVHGNLKSYKHHYNYQLNGTLGCLQDLGGGEIGVYVEQPGQNCRGERKNYSPAPVIAGSETSGHDGSDFYTMYYFIRTILGDETARERSIDVYEAVDMCMPGTLGYRSILAGNAPIRLPNLRNPAEREQYRHDTFCTFKGTAGDMYVPSNVKDPYIPDEVYAKVKEMWEKGIPG